MVGSDSGPGIEIPGGIRAESALKRIAAWGGGFALVVGCLGVAGWISGVQSLTSIRPDYIPMAPDTAIMFVLFGLIMVVNAVKPLHGHGRALAVTVLAPAAIYGLLKLLEFFIGIDITFENAWFPVSERLGAYPVGRMSPITGALFFLSGVVLTLRLWRSAYDTLDKVNDSLGAVVWVVGAVAMTGYIFGTPILYGGDVIPLALTTSFGFVMLGSGLVATAGPRGVFVRPFMGPSARAMMLRVFLPLVTAAVMLSSLMSRFLEAYVSHALLGAVASLGFVVITGVLVFRVARGVSWSIEKVELERDRVQQALADSEVRYRRLFETAQDGILILDADTGQIADANPFLMDLLGYTMHDLAGKRLWEIGVFSDKAMSQEVFVKLQKEGYVRYENLPLQSKSGKVFDVEFVSNAYLVDHEKVIQCNIRNVTERKQAEDQLRHNAFHDALTDLPNRALLLDRLAHALEQVKRKADSGVTVMYMDLDRFKNVNDSTGHVVGDALLKAVALRLQECVRSVDTVARLGGDEFVVLLEDTPDIATASRVTARIQKAFELPFEAAGNQVVTAASIGITFSTSGAESGEGLLRDADTAMYRAKSEGGARVVVFDPEMHARVLANLQMEAELQQALKNQEFRLFYQPIVSLTTGRMTGCEALIRWQHPVRGLLAPDAFLKIAEENGDIVPIGRWVLDAACAQMRAWREAGFELPCININVAASQFGNVHLPDEVMAVLGKYDLNGEAVTLEIVESMALGNVEDSVARLDKLVSSGVRVVLDDFGTGYSSLGILQRLPLNGIKIAQTFVRGIPADARNATLAKAIIQMAHDLGLVVVSEGVETEGQMAFLRAAWCDEVQGYLVSQPVPADEFVQLMRKGQLL